MNIIDFRCHADEVRDDVRGPGTTAAEINGGMAGFHDSCVGAEIPPMMKFDFRQIGGRRG